MKLLLAKTRKSWRKLTQRVRRSAVAALSKGPGKLRSALNTAVFELSQAISAWRDRYIVQSPAQGVITLPNYWSTKPGGNGW